MVVTQKLHFGFVSTISCFSWTRFFLIQKTELKKVPKNDQKVFKWNSFAQNKNEKLAAEQRNKKKKQRANKKNDEVDNFWSPRLSFDWFELLQRHYFVSVSVTTTTTTATVFEAPLVRQTSGSASPSSSHPLLMSTPAEGRAAAAADESEREKKQR